MTTPPEPVLKAALLVLHRGLIYARNLSIPASGDMSLVNNLMEALHEIPDFLVHWSQHSVEELRLHLATFKHSSWPGSPDLVSIFDTALNGHDRI